MAAVLGCGARTTLPVPQEPEALADLRPRATEACEELSLSNPVSLRMPGLPRPPPTLLGAVERTGALDVLTSGGIMRVSHGSSLEVAGVTELTGMGPDGAFATNGRYLAAWAGPTRYTILDEKNALVTRVSGDADEASSAAWHGDHLTGSFVSGVNPRVPSFLTISHQGTMVAGPTAEGFTPGPFRPVAVFTRSRVVQVMVAPTSAEVRFAPPGEASATFSTSGRVAFVTEWPFDTRSIVWHGFADGALGTTPLTIERMNDGGLRTTVAVLPLSAARRHAIKLAPSRWGLVVLDLAEVDDVATDVTLTLLHEDGRASPPTTFRADHIFAGTTGLDHDFVFGEIAYGGMVIAWNPTPPKDPTVRWMTQAVLLSCER